MAPKRARMRSTGVDVPARLDLDLDPLIAGGELALDLASEIVERVGWMPIDTPDAMRSRGCRRATRRERLAALPARSRSHAAISTAAFAMLWPRMRLERRKDVARVVERRRRARAAR